MNGPQVSWIAVVALVGVWAAAWVDFRSFRIPNTFVLAVAGLGLLTQVWHSGTEGLWQGLAGLALGFGLLLPLYLWRLMGAGDVKLMAGVGALLGPERVLLALMLALVAGGVMGVGYAVAAWLRHAGTGPWSRYGDMLRLLLVTRRPSYVPPAPGEAMAARLPVAVPIAAGSTVALLWPNVLGLLCL